MSIPTTSDASAWLRLTLAPDVPASAQRAWLQRFSSASAVLAESDSVLVELAGAKACEALRRGPDAAIIERTLHWLSEPGHHLITLDDARYPELLRELHVPPPVLYAIGREELLRSGPCLAIVGSRNATPQGRRNAHAFARALSDAGLCIVSGLAHGIDAAAHAGALEGRASSVAVMGTGPDMFYPSGNRDLARRLAQSGCLVTEFCLGTPPLPGNFPRRNRLISGLARGVLVVEATDRSGSLVTARLAVEQNREVFALPGSIHSPHSKGCHKLIKEGAKLVDDMNDILVELRMAPADARASRADREHEAPSHPLLAAMGFDMVSLDQLTERTGLGASACAAQLSMLEIEGWIDVLSGGLFQARRAP